MHLEEVVVGALEPLVLAVDLVAVIIMTWGALRAVLAVVPVVAVSGVGNKQRSLGVAQVRCDLGGYLLLGLELMIVSDAIETVVNRSLEELAYLGGIVVLRTVLSFFLSREIAELSEIGRTG